MNFLYENNIPLYFLLVITTIVACDDSSNQKQLTINIKSPFAAYLASEVTLDNNNLYVANIDGSGVYRISKPDIEGMKYVQGYSVSYDGRFVAYIGDFVSNLAQSFVVSSIDGKRFVNIQDLLGKDFYFDGNYQWSPATRKLAFWGRKKGTLSNFVFVLDADNFKLTNISENIQGSEGSVGNYYWSPDGSSVALVIYNLQPDLTSLYVIDSNGIQISKISGFREDVASSGIDSVKWAPNNSELAFQRYFLGNSNYTNEIYAVSVASGNAVRVSQTNEETIIGVYTYYEWSSDSKKIVYNTSVLNDVGEWLENNVRTVRSDSTNNTLLLAQSLPDYYSVNTIQWAPDGSRIAIHLYAPSLSSSSIYTFYPDGTHRYVAADTSNSDCGIINMMWSPDSEKIAYVYSCNASATQTISYTELYTVSPDGTQRLNVSGTPTIDGGGVASYSWSPAGSWIAYYGNFERFWGYDIYAASPGEIGIKISGERSGAENVLPGYQWTPDGSKLVYPYGEGEYAFHNSVGLRVSSIDKTEIDKLIVNYRAQRTGFLFSIHSFNAE